LNVLLAGAVAAVALHSPSGAAQVRGWVETHRPCMAKIIGRAENKRWDPLVAGGLPQAQPASKMASAGPDWRTNPWTQLRWMEDYVGRRYGGACAAWRHELEHGWY
jgi:hypothetical protein